MIFGVILYHAYDGLWCYFRSLITPLGIFYESVYIAYMGKKELSILLCVLALGAFLRFYHITTIPPGLYPDEAMNGNNALEALHTGNFKTFYPDNNGREGLFINIQAISVWLFGREAWVLRIISAIFGTLTILGVYLAAKELLQKDKIALLAAFFTATSYWHLNFSRIGFRAITTPFFLVFGLYFLLRGFRKNSIWTWYGQAFSLDLDFRDISRSGLCRS